jgi:hypothetical protein
MQFIILTRISDGKAVYVNPKQICYMGTIVNNEIRTLIQFCGDDENYIQVSESPETIAELCKGVTE